MIRSIVLGLAFWFVGLPCAVASAREPDGQITFYTYYLKEQRTVRYRDDGRILPEGLKQIERIFRSRDSDALMPVDIRLLDLLDRIEDHFGVRQVEVISGYRSQAFNKELKATGHSVANESFHTKGMAADIHLDEITEGSLKGFALSLGAGGVGYYPSLDMVHVDVGPVRTWGEAAPRKAWIGERNEAVPVTLTVAPTQSIGEKRLESLRIEGAGTIRPEVEIQFFDGDQWSVVGKIDARTALNKQKEAFIGLPFGKFRLKATVMGSPDQFQFSNEFYFKRK